MGGSSWVILQFCNKCSSVWSYVIERVEDAQRFSAEWNASWWVLNDTYHHQTRCKSNPILLQLRNCHYQNETIVAPDCSKLVGFNKTVKVWPRNNQKSVRDGLDPDQSFKAQVHTIEDLFTWSWNMCSAHHINFGVAWKDHQLLQSVKALVWLCNSWVWELRVVFPILQINQILVALLLAISGSWYLLMWEDELT